jgi:hypothetical protein
VSSGGLRGDKVPVLEGVFLGDLSS